MFFILYLQVYASDCDLVISLATGLGFNENTSKKLSSIVNNCCDTDNTGVVCLNETVTSIDWAYFRSLNGSINATAIPPKLSFFSMADNKITGNIPRLPDTVTHVYLFANKFNGSIPTLPASVYDYRVWRNDLTGEMPTFLGYNLFYAHYNRLTGSIPSLNRTFQFDMSNNLLTGSIPPLRDLRSFNIAGNLMSGIVPKLPPLLRHFRLGSLLSNTNNFHGSLVIDKPIVLYLVNNSFTNITIEDTSILTNCDISYNPLPYDVVQLYPMCLQVGTGSNYSVIRQMIYSSTIMDTSAYNTEYSTYDTEYTTSESYTDSIYEWVAYTEVNSSKAFHEVSSTTTKQKTAIALKTRIANPKPSVIVSMTSSSAVVTDYIDDDQSTMSESEMLTTLSRVFLFVDTSPTITLMVNKDIFSIGKLVIDVLLIIYMLVAYRFRKRIGSHKRSNYYSNQ